MDLHEELESLKESHPLVVAEFERLKAWVHICIGHHVAAPGGPSVDDE